ncbi:unnamed protein product [Schistosoma guineensis]|nr:unnamed protein product [Schistosoma guineensis]
MNPYKHTEDCIGQCLEGHPKLLEAIRITRSLGGDSKEPSPWSVNCVVYVSDFRVNWSNNLVSTTFSPATQSKI